MEILFDTHTLLWFLEDSPHLTNQARRIIAESGAELYFSAVSIEEIAIKHSLKPELMVCSPSQIRDAAEASHLKELPFDSNAAIAVGSLPWNHRDPFDRMLIAQAVTTGLKLLSHDDNVLRYGSMTIGY